MLTDTQENGSLEEKPAVDDSYSRVVEEATQFATKRLFICPLADTKRLSEGEQVFGVPFRLNDKNVWLFYFLDGKIMNAKCPCLGDETPHEFYAGLPGGQRTHIDISDEGQHNQIPSEMLSAVMKAMEWLNQHPDNCILSQCFGAKSRSVAFPMVILMHTFPDLKFSDLMEIIVRQRSLSRRHTPITMGMTSPFGVAVRRLCSDYSELDNRLNDAEVADVVDNLVAQVEFNCRPVTTHRTQKCSECNKWRCRCKNRPD